MTRLEEAARAYRDALRKWQGMLDLSRNTSVDGPEMGSFLEASTALEDAEAALHAAAAELP